MDNTVGVVTSARMPFAGNETLDGVLRASLEVLAPLRTVIPELYEQLSELARGTRHSRLRIGVVGITSSGKSTFINALLGETLLPEQSKATTNLPVICRKGERRRVAIQLLNGTSQVFDGERVTQDLVRGLCSEDGNPGNTKHIARLEIEVPTCCLPDQLEMIDTPGTDAFGLPQHEEITLRKGLTITDIVVFMTQARRPFAKSDAHLLERILDNQQRVLFVISHADIERDEREGGRLIRTRKDKLQNHVNNLAQELRRTQFSRLRESGIVAVSSKLAKDAKGDHTSTPWHDSNFDVVLEFFRQYAGDLSTVLATTRLDHARGLLATLHAVLQKQTGPLEERQKITPREESITASVARFTSAERASRRRLSTVQSSVAQAMDVQRLHGEMTADLARIDVTDISAFNRAIEHLAQQWQSETDAHMRSLDDARKVCRERLYELELTTGRDKVANRLLRLPSFPTVGGSLVQKEEAYTVAVPRTSFFGKIWDALAGVRTQHRTRTYDAVDRTALRRALHAFLTTAVEAFTTFVDEECETIAELYIDPIRERREADERTLKELREFRTRAASDLTTLPLVSDDLRDLLQQLPQPKPSVYESASPLRSPFAAAVAADPGRPEHVSRGGAALYKVLARAWEGAAIARFWRTVTLLAGEAPRSVCLAGMSGAAASQLIAFLTRSRAETVRKGAPAALIDVLINHRGSRTRVFSLDNGSSLAEYRGACASASVIAVEVEAARLSAGVKRLVEAPVFSLLREFAPKILFIADEGAYFDTHLHDLITEVIPLVSSATGFAQAPWFVCETSRYDARYSNFVELAVQVRKQDGSGHDLARLWRQEGLSMRPPFQEQQLRDAFSLIAAYGDGSLR